SILGLSLVTAFTSTSPGLTCPGLLAPDRRDAGSRRVGSRVHGRSEDRGYVVPQASDVSVAGDARWGSRPMAEHRVMSEDHLGLTHYRSRRCYESQPNWQRPNGTRSRRAARPYSVCHRNSVCYRTRQFLRTNRSFFPHSPPPDRYPLSRGRRRSRPVAPGVPAGPLWVAVRIPSLCDHARPGKGGEVHDQLYFSLAVDCLQFVIALEC